MNDHSPTLAMLNEIQDDEQIPVLTNFELLLAQDDETGSPLAVVPEQEFWDIPMELLLDPHIFEVQTPPQQAPEELGGAVYSEFREENEKRESNIVALPKRPRRVAVDVPAGCDERFRVTYLCQGILVTTGNYCGSNDLLRIMKKIEQKPQNFPMLREKARKRQELQDIGDRSGSELRQNKSKKRQRSQDIDDRSGRQLTENKSKKATSGPSDKNKKPRSYRSRIEYKLDDKDSLIIVLGRTASAYFCSIHPRPCASYRVLIFLSFKKGGLRQREDVSYYKFDVKQLYQNLRRISIFYRDLNMRLWSGSFRRALTKTVGFTKCDDEPQSGKISKWMITDAKSYERLEKETNHEFICNLDDELWKELRTEENMQILESLPLLKLKDAEPSLVSDR